MLKINEGMRAKNTRLSFRPSEKLCIYLSTLGLFDRRSGTLRKDCKVNLSELMNKALIILLEKEKNPYSHMATPQELVKGWMQFQTKELYDQIEELHEAYGKAVPNIKVIQ